MSMQNFWEKGLSVPFPQTRPERIKGPLFHEMYWKDLDAKTEKAAFDERLVLNGEERRIKTIGWQGSRNGFVELHKEKIQEDMNVANGTVIMAKVLRDKTSEVKSARGLHPLDSLPFVPFVLAIATTETGLEYLALKVFANFTAEMAQLTTLPGESHSTLLPDWAWYLVVKHERVNLS